MSQTFFKTVGLARENFCILFFAAILFSTQSLTQPISITDFRIPTSKYQRLAGNLNGYWSKSSSEYGNGNLTTTDYSSGDFQNEFTYVLGQFSEDRSLEVNASMSSYYSSYSNSDDDLSQPYHNESNDYFSSISLSPNVRYTGYIEPDTWFWTAQVQGNGQYGYGHSNTTVRSTSQDTSWSDFRRQRNYQYSVSAGVGYGKMRDGQSIFAALRVLEKLDEDGALVRPLTREETLRLADYLARKSEYTYSQDRYYKFLVQDLIETLTSMGVMKGGTASAYDVMRAFEVLLYERIEPRMFGWRVSAGITRTATQSDYERSNPSPSFRTAMEFLQLQTDYGYPVSINTQLSASGAVMVPRKDPKRRIGVTLSGSAVYQLTERIDASLIYSLNRNSSSLANDDTENFQRDLIHRVSLGFRFFIENNVSFNVSGGYEHRKTDLFSPPPGGYGNTYSTTTASFGITYRFL
jgi:hypothetical protein